MLDMAVRHVMMCQGVVGVTVSTMLPQDPKGVLGPKIPVDDVVTILEPKEELSPAQMLANQQMQAAQAYSAPPMMEAAAPPMVDPAAAPVVLFVVCPLFVWPNATFEPSGKFGCLLRMICMVIFRVLLLTP
jgi:hypothetical protein